ncbi:hypothetical protein CYLTODRAFT_447571 [Cylindrobasidium torrendii FP15055 ss-10]|uniref:Uncharacterized protein n=1 Tax=Cylindrobasidium torrendii FP15055 ss-10 TaxID=1314674 RepID=A0A0D7AUT3_9AGAR|nr:hypothetical protein CYLTODRAFT_447571 [Cylindrobasidium torrendii FP15055 ss-10]
MSSYSYSAPKPRMSTRKFAQLLDNLDFQRVRYQRTADFHALMVRQHMSHGTSRSRARALKLTVDTERARELEQKQVSVVPLPLISASYHPRSPPVHTASEELYCHPRPAPAPAQKIHTWNVPSHTPNVPNWNTAYACDNGEERIVFDEDDCEIDEDDWSDRSEYSSSESSEEDDVPPYYFAPSSDSSYGTLLSPYQSILGVKRKSPDMCKCEEYSSLYHVSVKQPKLLRKSWAQPVRDGAAF